MAAQTPKYKMTTPIPPEPWFDKSWRPGEIELVE
jgi:hypothetical protein